MNQTKRGTMCNRAIMIITDGAPETFEDIFQKYNWPNKFVSVFGSTKYHFRIETKALLNG